MGIQSSNLKTGDTATITCLRMLIIVPTVIKKLNINCGEVVSIENEAEFQRMSDSNGKLRDL